MKVQAILIALGLAIAEEASLHRLVEMGEISESEAAAAIEMVLK